ncbi:hypothetical protein [Legionella micdadei]|uniref:Coiled-coil protein n=1 Tax=Legionella micdadei TaxID=451 RepID=A0A098GCK2_LEGMI|nr:hypothetical protein [Legionella micdadei]ARG98156.1 hypothetical protein B6N58_11100 [Legionella micdadei]ARH00951.1 hypothetical protein B6V88_11320 [Legionella micdadei]KTD29930.1 hypothetical protein Lmic_0365 [Legionella micdadei]NSL19519.1 hypothetical protein [Legionella micdadei]CEG60188.1 conserved protein of unknown function [Legionella micdadei]
MNDLSVNKIDHLVDEAKTYLHETKSILSKLLQVAIEDEDSSDGDKILSIQLTLQYRLSCEDALSLLLKIDHNLLYFLGIQPQHSAKTNIDRLAYAVGNEDLKQILNVLALLIGSLSKIIARYKNDQAIFALKGRKPSKQHMLTGELSKLLARQQQFVNALHKLELEIEPLLKLQAIGPVYDHIAALRGPISHFYQAILHNIGQGEELYHHVNKTPLIDYQLNSLLEEAAQVLHLMPSIYNPHPTYPLKQFDHQLTSEQLEQRATAKRLRPFFG